MKNKLLLFVAGFVVAFVLFGPIFSVGQGKITGCGITINSPCFYERYEHISLVEKIFSK